MKTLSTLNKKFILVLPALAVIIWHSVIMLNGSNFFNSRIDPEYPYLMNGLNCALGEFHRIGHVDHPGTPFQMLTGFFILVLHFFLGHDDLASDVISRPEWYLFGCSFLLTLLASMVTLYTTLKIYSITQSFKISLLIGSSLLLYKVVIDMQYRYFPDYFLLIIVLLLAIPILQYIYNPKYSSTKFILFTGILSGIGAITKVNFAPLILVPFILVDRAKNKLLFILVFAITAFINFLPIIEKHPDVRKFLLGITNHDGFYGKGEAQFMSLIKFKHNFTTFASSNTWFLIIFVGILVFLVIAFKNKRTAFLKDRTIRFFIGFILSSLIGLVLVLKHYKGYYFGPFFALSIVALAILWLKFKETSKHKWFINTLFIVLISFHFMIETKQVYKTFTVTKADTQNKNLTDILVQNYLNPTSYKIIEPSWYQSLTIDCGLAYGLSYTSKNSEYYNEFHNKYPNTLSWEGKEKPIRFLRMTPFFDNAIFYSGKKISLLHGPQNFATADIISYLTLGSEARNIDFVIDTVFYDKNSQNYIFEYTNKSSWRCLNATKCGFENTQKRRVLANDGLTQLTDQDYQQNSEQKNTGNYSLLLSGNFKTSPGILLDSLKFNDYILVTVKAKGKLPNNIKDIIEWNGGQISDQDLIIIDSSSNSIGNKWNLIQLGIQCKDSSAKINCVNILNSTNTPLFVDDFEVEHFSSN